jgi:hypothetical protein
VGRAHVNSSAATRTDAMDAMNVTNASSVGKTGKLDERKHKQPGWLKSDNEWKPKQEKPKKERASI